MPSGRTHDRITFWSLPAVVALSLLRTRSGGLTLAIATGFLFGALMLGPDLDTRSIHYRRWGIFRWIWIPYRGSMKHRSPLSHWPIVGTVVRVAYVLVWLLLVVLVSLSLVNEAFQLSWTWDDMGRMVGQSLATHRSVVWMLVIGLELGALSHYLADWSVSTYKRVRKRYPQEGIAALRLIWQPSPRRRKHAKRRSPPRKTKLPRQ
ncbi:MAG: metal-binding protein [Elainellaceae cyanobacterium]